MDTTKRYNGACDVIVRDGRHFLKLPDGQEVPKTIFTRVYDGLDERYAIVKLFVNFPKELNTQTKDSGPCGS
jgi:hypothetical protein